MAPKRPCLGTPGATDGLGQPALFPRTVARWHADRGGAAPGRRPHHGGAPGAGAGEAVRPAAVHPRRHRLQPGRGRAAPAGAGRGDGKRLPRHRAAGGGRAGHPVRLGAHRRHRGLRRRPAGRAAGGPRPALPAPGHRPAGGTAHRASGASRGGHRHHPGAPGARAVHHHPAHRLRAAPVRLARLSGSPSADPPPRGPAPAPLRQLHRGPAVQQGAVLPGRDRPPRPGRPAQHQHPRPAECGAGRCRAGDPAELHRAPRAEAGRGTGRRHRVRAHLLDADAGGEQGPGAHAGVLGFFARDGGGQPRPDDGAGLSGHASGGSVRPLPLGQRCTYATHVATFALEMPHTHKSK
ncbi:hypothetical protein OF001_U220051 [Pseudomonas sp. OF001]|nr:hypothetical protein OF001_U220051 [Pseudomonas sp. OF001]